MIRKFFTSESVTAGHPDKMADQISDAILDAILSEDPAARVAVETFLTTGQVHIGGEVTTIASVDYAAIARQVIQEIGYDASWKGFDGATCGINVSIGQQSPDIAQGVNFAVEREEGSEDLLDFQGAGDQGIMFGYACNETKNLMPAAIEIAHRLAGRLHIVREQGYVQELLPDGKTQVTLVYEGDYPVAIDTVVISAQHEAAADLKQLKQDIQEFVIEPVLKDYGHLDQSELKILINPTGRFVIGGPMGDAGLTGRKIIVDTYGGAAPHGGGAFSGKDPSKVDRSAAYAARWIAKTVVAAGLAEKCQIQVAYAIGKAKPVGVYVDTFNTGVVTDDRLAAAIEKTFDLRPAAIVRDLKLKDVKYQAIAAYGHMGRVGLPWEQPKNAARLINNIL